jgi:hypothetical protein
MVPLPDRCSANGFDPVETLGLEPSMLSQPTVPPHRHQWPHGR